MSAIHPFDERSREQLDRRESRKWSLHSGAIGAWVAEMDFGTAPPVTEALQRAIREETLGYLSPALAADLGEATAAWMSTEYGWQPDPARVHPVADVIAGLGVAVTEYSPAGSPVIVPTPAYMPFLTYLATLGHPVMEVPGIVENGRWTHDIEAIDEAFAQGAVTLVLCNPHNPTGSVLSREELERIAEVVDRHGGRVYADEIHAPVRFGTRPHIPYASLSDVTASHTITGTSASKAWNIAGLKAAQLITSNDHDEERYRRFGFAVVHGASTLGVIASTAAYREGGPWLRDTVDYLDGNRVLLGDLLSEHVPGAVYVPPDATYLGWIDTSEYRIEGSPAEFFREHAGVVLTDGRLCGVGFERFVRIAFATPRPILRDTVTALGESLRGVARG